MLDKLEEYKDAAFIFFEYGEYQKAMDKTAVKVIDIHGANEYKIISKTRAASRGIVIENARMLISHEENVDYYSIPGGGLEKGETPEEGCIREIREEVAYSPAEGRYKVYIIDEVHMLTMQAFNALLKTLEEPPEHTVFILATTEVHKLPQTILSRCMRFDFRLLSTAEIKNISKPFCETQKLVLESKT